MHFNWLIHVFVYISVQQVFANSEQNTDRDDAIIKTCMEYHKKDMEMVKNHTNWLVEEIPCFAHCIAEAKGWFNVQTNRWNKQKIAEELGASMYNYCRFALNGPFEDACEFTHQGLKCLKQAEQNIPLIEAAAFGCTLELNITLNQLAEYIPLQHVEKIPCYFACFARKMELYDANFEWNVDNWIKALGSPHENISLYRNRCKATEYRKRPQENNCTWMYAEYICVDHFSYHLLQTKIYKNFL